VACNNIITCKTLCKHHQPFIKIKADRPLMHDTLNVPWLLTNRQFQWSGNGHSQLPLAELSKPSPNIDLLRTKRESVNNFKRLTLTFNLWPWPKLQDSQGQGRPSCQKSRLKVKRFKQESTHRQTNKYAHTWMLPIVLFPLVDNKYNNYIKCTVIAPKHSIIYCNWFTTPAISTLFFFFNCPSFPGLIHTGPDLPK